MNLARDAIAALIFCSTNAQAFAPSKFRAVYRSSTSSLTSVSYQNDGPFAFMQDFLEIGGLTKEGKSIYFGAFTKDANPNATPAEEAAKVRQLASENLTNIDDAERARRDQAGDVMTVLSAMYVLWASLFADDGGFGGHVLRMIAVMPIFLAYGYKKSAQSGL